MLNSISQLLHKTFQLGSGKEKWKSLGLHFILITGLILSLVDFTSAMSGNTSYPCIPGDVTLMATFMVALYCLRNGRPGCAINSVFLIPFPVYFFFIARPYAILPVHSTLQHSLWALVGGFVFLLLFNPSKLKLALFYSISLLTVAFHLSEAGRLPDALNLIWQRNELIFNPFLVLSAVFAASFLVAWSFESSLHELRNKVAEMEMQFSQTFRNFHQGVMLMQINRDEMDNPVSLQVLRVNHAFETLFRINSRELRNIEADIIFPKVFRQSFDWNNFFLHSKKQKVELHIEHLNKWMEMYVLHPAKDQLACLFYDISQKQHNIISLKESRKRYKVLLEAIPDLFFIIDKDGIYVDFVIKESDLILIKADDIIGNSIFEVGFSEKMSRKIFQCIQNAIRFDTIETIEYALETEKGTAMFEMRIAKLDDQSVISIARDITKRKVAEIRLEEAKLKAEEADQLKSAFLANISHEIRTPMNAIIGFSRMIGSPDFDLEEKNRFIDIIISNGKLLMEMINDMISISKIESKQVIAKKGFCKINDLMVELYREYSLEVSSKPIRLKLNNENANPKFGVATDKFLLTEVLKKLIDNAIKFTSLGEVEFGYQMEGKTKLRFFVNDTGIGMEPHHLDRIFDRFHQIDNKMSRKYEGTGLGLAIAQHYTNLLGGKIVVESEVDKGSKFYFSIPFEDGESTLKVIR
ncbi:PAS domain-containing sensor histidine kinase [Gaoshiqia sediminis]|uniref:histidine kinase n=1 Tax=Gaoshiqia sediminis TaxID=2986998 RepID=A0AA41Y0E0_9BACT|nr:PAS domain-containing hybrid sensor histidine kinase/response regulator [Gaoshiqia sediminis]MCW0481146.1 ATP-binding protein [Gaoshiqia sediminis]